MYKKHFAILVECSLHNLCWKQVKVASMVSILQSSFIVPEFPIQNLLGNASVTSTLTLQLVLVLAKSYFAEIPALSSELLKILER